VNKKVLKKYLVGDFTIRRLIRSVATIYVCLAIFAWFGSDRMIFQPQPCSYKDDVRIIKVETGDGSFISATYLLNPSSEYTILYCHANAVDLGDIREFITRYHALGFSVFAYDYPGYGTSSGRPTVSGACNAADAALKRLIEQGVPLDRIIVHGRSVGGGPALYLAHANDVAGVIVESSFVSAFRVMTQIPIIPFDKFRNIARIDDINCPLLVIHGREDSTIPFWHGEKLFLKAKEPKVNCWLDRTTHNIMPVAAEQIYWKAIVSFRELIRSEKARKMGHSYRMIF